MLNGLRKKWNVSGWQLVLILVTFALGGSLCGYLGRKLLGLFALGNNAIRIPLYIILVTLLWPFCVILISIPMGQFRFFTAYLKKMGSRMGIGRKEPAAGGQLPVAGEEIAGNRLPVAGTKNLSNMKTADSQPKFRIAIFASGAGSNAQKIIDHFRLHPEIRVDLIVCNKPNAGVLGIAEKEGIPSIIIDKEKFFRGNAYVDELKAKQIDLVVLAGFLWKIPTELINHWPGKIINIHPALLPKYGGKGMYGNFVHEAVVASKEKESGITIHFVDEHYDHGATIFQAVCEVEPDDTAQTLAAKIHALEHEHFPRVIESVLLNHR